MYEFDYKYKFIDNKQVHTIGCLTSENDAINFSTTVNEDSIIISTCYFIKQREYENIIIIDLLKTLYPTKKIYIVGCGAEYLKEKYKDCICLNNTQLNEIIDLNKSKSTNHFLNIKIQEGCPNNCSFCLVHKLRGKLYSTPYDTIKEIINNELKTKTHINLNLCGIELTNYKDVKYNIEFTGLINKILNDFNEVTNINIGMSLDPAYSKFIDFLKIVKDNRDRINSPICLAVQSCNDIILKKMRRKHTAYNIDQISSFANENNIDMMWEVIVGFPGETEDYFLDTLNYIKKYKPSELAIFPYSLRENTDAYSMDNQIDEEIKQKRVNILYKESINYNLHKHNIQNTFSLEDYKMKFKNVISEGNFIKLNFDINNIKNIFSKIKNSTKHCILQFEYKNEIDKIYINFFKEFLPDIFILVKSNIISNKELFENQFHCMVL